MSAIDHTPTVTTLSPHALAAMAAHSIHPRHMDENTYYAIGGRTTDGRSITFHRAVLWPRTAVSYIEALAGRGVTSIELYREAF
jgi:hypothetical protein